MCKSQDIADASTTNASSASSDVPSSETENLGLDFAAEDFQAKFLHSADFAGYADHHWWPAEFTAPMADPYWAAMAWNPLWNMAEPSMIPPFMPKQHGQRRRKADTAKTVMQPMPSVLGTSETEAGEVCMEETRTTLMIRNLPNDYTRDMLLKLLDDEGFEGKYDFAYVPIDFSRWAGFGYAFVNFVTGPDADRARISLNGFSRWQVGSHKVCEVSWSHPVQGLDENIKRYRNSPVMHTMVPDDVKPVLYTNGLRVAFPEPTKKIRLPRFKKGPKAGVLPIHFTSPMDIDISVLSRLEEDGITAD